MVMLVWMIKEEGVLMMIRVRISRKSRGLVLGLLVGRTLGFDYDGMPLNSSV